MKSADPILIPSAHLSLATSAPGRGETGNLYRKLTVRLRYWVGGVVRASQRNVIFWGLWSLCAEVIFCARGQVSGGMLDPLV